MDTQKEGWNRCFGALRVLSQGFLPHTRCVEKQKHWLRGLDMPCGFISHSPQTHDSFSTLLLSYTIVNVNDPQGNYSLHQVKPTTTHKCHVFFLLPPLKLLITLGESTHSLAVRSRWNDAPQRLKKCYKCKITPKFKQTNKKNKQQELKKKIFFDSQDVLYLLVGGSAHELVCTLYIPLRMVPKDA